MSATGQEPALVWSCLIIEANSSADNPRYGASDGVHFKDPVLTGHPFSEIMTDNGISNSESG